MYLDVLPCGKLLGNLPFDKSLFDRIVDTSGLEATFDDRWVRVSRVVFAPALTGTYLIAHHDPVFQRQPAFSPGLVGIAVCLGLAVIVSGLLYGVYRLTLKLVRPECDTIFRTSEALAFGVKARFSPRDLYILNNNSTQIFSPFSAYP